jgi:ABC-type multidrug transport system fused ATPase/permease subunit
MWRVTVPYVWRAGRERWVNVLVVAVGGVVAGGVATAKSLLESGIIQQVADAITSRDTSSVLSRPLDRFSATDGDWAARLTGWLLPGIALREAVVVYLLVSITGACMAVITTSSRESISRSLFARLYAAGLNSAFKNNAAADVQANEPGGLAGAVQQGARSVSSGYAFLVEALQYVVALSTIVLLLSGVSPVFAAFCVTLAILFAGISWIRGRHLAAKREYFDEQRRDLFAFTDDVISNRDVLLAHERKDSYVKKLTGTAKTLATVDKQLSVRERAYSGTVNVLYDAGRIGILAVVLWAASRGSAVEKVGDAYFYISIFTRLMSPIQSLLTGYDDVRRSMSSSKILVGLLKAPSEHRVPVDDSKASPSDNASEAARLERVNFAYPGGPQVVEDCSFRVPRGGVTLIVGRSGAGKTTIARMLLGFHQPQVGIVEVLGRRLDTWEHDALLAKMSYLAQTGHIVEGTVRENLFADESLPVDQLVMALHAAGLVRDPLEADELLAKEAREMSEGQKQRLALARILVDRSPLIVLDEPLAGVDVFTFEEVKDALVEWMNDPERTVVLISHRLAFASCASHVVVLGTKGQVIEEGAPAALASNPGGQFARLLDVTKAELTPAAGTPATP